VKWKNNTVKGVDSGEEEGKETLPHAENYLPVPATAAAAVIDTTSNSNILTTCKYCKTCYFCCFLIL